MNSLTIAGRGYLTLVFGNKRFLNQAVVLALSLKRWDPNTPRAVVCERSSQEFLSRYFDHIIPLKEGLGKGTHRKIGIYGYTPFEETMFIDADSIVVKNVERLWEKLGGCDFGVFGSLESSGVWRYDIKKACTLFSVSSMPKINGGCYYFRSSKGACELFEQALKELSCLSATRISLGLPADGKESDEFLMSVAMAKLGIHPTDDREERVMIGPLQLMEGRVRMDALKGVFECWNDHVRYRPVVAHFFLGLHKGFHYRRESFRLKFVEFTRLPWGVVAVSVHVFFNWWYFLLTCAYSISRKMKKKPHVYPMACIPFEYFFGGIRGRCSVLIKKIRKR